MAVENCISYNEKGECRHQRVIRHASRGEKNLKCNKKCTYQQILPGEPVTCQVCGEAKAILRKFKPPIVKEECFVCVTCIIKNEHVLLFEESEEIKQ